MATPGADQSAAHGTDGLADGRFLALLAAAVDHAFITYDADGVIRGWSPGAETLSGYAAEHAIGRRHGLLHPRAAVLAGEPDKELAATRDTGHWAGRGWRQRRDGTRFWAGASIVALREDGELVGYGNVLRDESAQRAAENTVRLTGQQMRYAFDAAPSAVAIMSVDGRWLRVNDALCRLTGRSREELLAGTLQELLEPGDPAAGLLDIADLTLGSETGTDTRIVRRDGRSIWVQLAVGVVRDETGRPLHLIVQLEDITARVSAAQAQDQALAEAAETHRTLLAAEAAKSSFLAVASHELRTPLAAIKGYGELMSRRWDDLTDERRRESAAIIERQARRLQLLVEDLLTLSTYTTDGLVLERRAVRLDELLDDVEETAGERVERHGTDLAVDADPVRLSQILLNLVVNAVKYGEPPYVVQAEQAGQRVRIAVWDHGDGVPQEFVPRLFDEFSQADSGLRRRSRGVGLGLAICRALADAHGATIGYEPHPYGGACFTVDIAAASAEPAPGGPAGVRPRRSSRSSGPAGAASG